MRQLERLLIIALNEQATNTVVEIMHTLCADFIEGENDIAGELFNKYFCKLYPEMQRKYIHTSPFEHHANKLAKKYGIAQPWREVSENPWEWEYKGFEQNPHGINQCDMPKLNKLQSSHRYSLRFACKPETKGDYVLECMAAWKDSNFIKPEVL